MKVQQGSHASHGRHGLRCQYLKVMVGWLLLAAITASANGYAEISRIVIDQRKPLRDSDGALVSGYEELRGRLFGDVDPISPSNALIQDIDLAPLNARGRVDYIATFTLYRALAPSTNSRVLLDVIPNRGHRYGAEKAYTKRKYSLVWIGWQGDLPEAPSAQTSANKLVLESVLVPRVHNRDGTPVLGPYLVRVPTLGGAGPSGTFMKLDQGSAGALAYFPASFDTHQATLSAGPAEDAEGPVRAGRYGIASADWSWWNCTRDLPPDTAKIPGDLCIKRVAGEFKPSEIYELVFIARDPLVLALGLAATRDGVSFFRYGGGKSGAKQNPLAGEIDTVLSHGQSQAGNLIKTFIALGFNRDERGRKVWDGANPHIAGRLNPINYRFATPGSSPTLFMPGSEGILWWGAAANPLRGGPPRSLLDRCNASGTCPKIIETFGGAELWNQRMTPGLVNFDLKRDIALPENVRRYYFPGTGHGGGRGGFALQGPKGLTTPGAPGTDANNGCVLQFNPNPETDQIHALTVALVDWVSGRTAPPASRYPSLASGELVSVTAANDLFPAIPHTPKPLGLANPVLVYDYGDRFNTSDLSGVITKQPPGIRATVPALVAKTDADGNETSGIPSVLHKVPLGTYLSWNAGQDPNRGPGVCAYSGGFVPFARTQAERLSLHDPRPSIEERYGSRPGFLCAVKKAARQAVRECFLLQEDVQRLIAEATTFTSSGELDFLASTPTLRSAELCASEDVSDVQ